MSIIQSIIQAILSLFGKKPAEKPTDPPAAQEPYNSAKAEELLRQVNKRRAEKGLAALKADEALTRAARIRAKEQRKKFSHTRPDGREWYTVLEECGVNSSRTGENLAESSICAADKIVTGWMNSEEHKGNVLDAKFTAAGAACYEKENKAYWAMLFKK